jgi:hypothetical protein
MRILSGMLSAHLALARAKAFIERFSPACGVTFLAYIQERFLDCVSRRFAQRQKRGTLRSE